MANLDDLVNLAAIGALEEAELAAARNRRHFHFRDDAFQLTDNAFVRLFRLTKVLANELIDSLEPYMTGQTRSSALDILTKVLTALRFFASGSYQLDIGQNINFAVSQSSVSRCINEVINAMTRPEIMNNWVKFPNTLNEMQLIRQEFFRKYRFPGVIGCIDCTHVAIVPPKIEDELYPERIYVNRKGYHSINVQLICDWRLKILNVNALYPGSTHDTFIWNNSRVSNVMEHLHRNHRHNNFYLLGDSGYPLRPWLQTPMVDVLPNTPEAAYNDRQMSTRSIIERCNGVLKMRFRCLLKHRVLHYSPETASKIINTCVILHNICITNNVPDPPIEEDGELDFGMYEHDDNDELIPNANERRINPDLATGRAVQRNIIRNYFTEQN